MAQKHRIHCDRLPEAHVVYDRYAAGYRAEVRCRCGLSKTTGRKLHERVVLAEAEAARLLERISAQP